MWNASLTRRSVGLGLVTGLALRAAGARSPALPSQDSAKGQGARPAADTGDASRWDRVFRQPKPVYRTDANAFLLHALERLQQEKLLSGTAALDLAMGDGRNALPLAERGLDVTGLDISPAALELARAKATEKGVELHALEQDLFAYDYGQAKWDLITVIYFNPAVSIFERLKAAVKPGGLIVIEGQGSEHRGEGPPPATRFRPNQLLQAFADWRTLDYQDGQFDCDWALGAPTHVVRLMARKTA